MTRLSFIVILLTVLSCNGEVEKQKLAEKQKAREDSIRLAVENQTRLRLERKNALQDSIRINEARLTGFRNNLITTTGELEAAKDKLNTIKEFQFLRSDAEREQQIKNQTIIILSFENNLGSIQESILNKQRNLEEWKSELSQLQ